MAFKIFLRTWWKENASWPNGLEPHPGEKEYIKEVDTEDEARAFCKKYNKAHDAGRLSLKAEFEEE
jgi:hypothetical protein